MIQSLRNQLERSGNVPAMSGWMGIKVTVLNCIKLTTSDQVVCNV